MKSQHGFTIIELIVVTAVLSIMLIAAMPVWLPIFENASEKEAARDIASALRDARSRSINENLEHRISFDLAAKTYVLSRGNRASNSASWTNIKTYKTPENILLRGTQACNTTDFTIQFNPNGTANSIYACIQDLDGTKQFATGVSHATTGKVAILRWNPSASAWE